MQDHPSRDEIKAEIKQIANELEGLISQKLSGEIGLGEICFVAEICNSTLEMITERFEHIKSEHQIACRDGCITCCTSMRVTVRPIFAIYALIAFRQQFDDRAYDEMTERLRSNPIYCTFLINESCSIYSNRPLVCRSYFSTNYDDCLEGTYNDRKHMERPLHQYSIRYIASYEIQQALLRVEEKLGLDTEPVHLHNALAILLNIPDAIERWAKGEKIFSQLT